MSTARIEEYLESIYKLQDEKETVNITKLAERLRISTASVSEMLKKLEKEGYIAQKDKRNYILTKNGHAAALNIIRRHRLSERLLTDIIGIPWEEAHEEACKFEHVIGEEVEHKLAESLGEPETCPHGHPIPRKDGTYVEEKSVPLTKLKSGESCVIIKVSEDDPKMLHYLASLGLLPQKIIKVEEVSPFGGPYLIDVSGAKYALGHEVAANIRVRSIKG
jgi:DtxR family Mn-dependent transcriptional regulator